MNMKVTLATEISDHLLHKIYEGIPVISADFTHASVRDYSEFNFSLDISFFIF
jgi:hypothetical protein